MGWQRLRTPWRRKKKLRQALLRGQDDLTSSWEGMGHRLGLVLAGEQRAGVAGIRAHGGEERKEGTMQLGETRAQPPPT